MVLLNLQVLAWKKERSVCPSNHHVKSCGRNMCDTCQRCNLKRSQEKTMRRGIALKTGHVSWDFRKFQKLQELPSNQQYTSGWAAWSEVLQRDSNPYVYVPVCTCRDLSCVMDVFHVLINEFTIYIYICPFDLFCAQWPKHGH